MTRKFHLDLTETENNNEKKYTVRELKEAFYKLDKIYEANFNIFYKFILEQYPNYDSSSILTFDLVENLEILLADPIKKESIVWHGIDYNQACYLDEDNIKELIYCSNNTEVLNAFNIIKAITSLDGFDFYCNNESNSINMEVDSYHTLGNKSYTYTNQDDDVINMYDIMYTPHLKDNIYNMIAKYDPNAYISFNMSHYKDRFLQYIHFVDNYENEYYNNLLFNSNGKLKNSFIGKSLEHYDLKRICFDEKNISGIDISKNPEARINFDKIVKDLTDSNLQGYNLNKYVFDKFILINTNLQETGATIDLGTCAINLPDRMNTGTLFDESNKFLLFGEKITNEQVENLGIKILKRS